ncbi:mercuric reductase [Deinococcus aestuarii]|uniref:mercuric reductase n=1 Tax=Deinococcus aestuarii TaxID=2774531 RepID=UPI001C0B3036|nr:mercuric reductase [Deinococcus aestuarii]
MDDTSFDVLIIGGGQAGIPLAHALAGEGRRVALAERKHLGGSCVNFGCTPTKAVLASARVAHQARRAAEYGLGVPEVRVDFPAVLARARRIADESRAGLEERLSDTDNPRWLRGHARLEGRDGGGFRVRVGDQLVTAAQVVLNTGTRSVIPDVEGLAEADVLHAGNWLDRGELPEHLALLGGGYIGAEMSQFYRRMGSRVTVIEQGEQLMDREDPDVASVLQDALRGEGIELRLNTELRRVERAGPGLRLTLGRNGRDETLEVTHLFVATGRLPNTDDLGLETVGARVAEHGTVEVDARLATNVPGLWVAGDIRGGPMFTHSAWDDHRVLLSQLAGDGSRTTAGRIVPYGVFTDPQLGRVGLTERQAREAGLGVRVACYEMGKNGKATEIGETQGLVKLVTEAESGKILGAAVLAAEGTEIVHVYIDLMNADAPVDRLRDAVHIHPTLAEATQSVTRLLT